MANDIYCDDSYLQAQIEQEEQEYLLWVEEVKLEEANKELRSLYYEYL